MRSHQKRQNDWNLTRIFFVQLDRRKGRGELDGREGGHQRQGQCSASRSENQTIPIPGKMLLVLLLKKRFQ